MRKPKEKDHTCTRMEEGGGEKTSSKLSIFHSFALQTKHAGRFFHERERDASPHTEGAAVTKSAQGLKFPRAFSILSPLPPNTHRRLIVKEHFDNKMLFFHGMFFPGTAPYARVAEKAKKVKSRHRHLRRLHLKRPLMSSQWRKRWRGAIIMLSNK